MPPTQSSVRAWSRINADRSSTGVSLALLNVAARIAAYGDHRTVSDPGLARRMPADQSILGSSSLPGAGVIDAGSFPRANCRQARISVSVISVFSGDLDRWPDVWHSA